MLQKLRERSSGWVATVIIGLLMIPFLFVIDSSYLGGMGANNVAQVKAPPAWWQGAPAWWPVSLLWQHEEVSGEEFRTRFEQERARQRQELGEAFDPRQFESTENKLKVLDELVDEKVLALAAHRAGVVISDEAVRNYIQQIPAFQVDGKFDLTTYQLTLASQIPPRTPEQFDQMVRAALLQSLIPSGVASSAFVTDAELERIVRLSGERRDVELAILPLPAEDTAEVSDAELGAWYEAHKGEYMRPETVSVEYVEVSEAQLPEQAPADEATLRKRYEDEKARFVEAERRLASHILVRVDAGADEATRKAAEDKARKLAEQARGGADFAALAKANSEDPGSRDSGGDLGWVEKGMMVPQFEQALFAMAAGEISGPVQTDYGYHVLQLREVAGGAQVPFEEARAELEREQATADRERAYSELSGRLTDLVYQNPSSLEPAARELGLQVRKAGPFARQDAPGILGAPQVLRAAFSEALIQDGTASDPIEVGPNHAVVVRVLDHAPEQARPLEEVRELVAAAVRADRRAKAAEAAAQAAVEKLQAGQSLQAVAEGAEVRTLDGMPRGMPAPTREASTAIFRLPAPEEGKSAAGHVALPDGSQAVFVVKAVHPGKLEELTEEQRRTLRQQLAQLDGNAAADAYVRHLRKQFKVQVQESQL